MKAFPVALRTARQKSVPVCVLHGQAVHIAYGDSREDVDLAALAGIELVVALVGR